MEHEAGDARPRTLSVEETAKELGISRNTAYEAARRGEIPTIQIGRRLLVPRIALERMLRGEAGSRAPFRDGR
jgi:excisionase family DNA binding protein